MVRENTEDERQDWVEARALLRHRLNQLDRHVEILQEKVQEQDKEILALKIKVTSFSALIAFIISAIPPLLKYFVNKG